VVLPLHDEAMGPRGRAGDRQGVGALGLRRLRKASSGVSPGAYNYVWRVLPGTDDVRNKGREP